MRIKMINKKIDVMEERKKEGAYCNYNVFQYIN